MSKVSIILEGLHGNHYKNDGTYLIQPLTSSVTLIQTHNKNILVDTGTPNYKDELLQNLKKQSLKPEEIDYLILTHHHLDHTFNAYLFPNVLIYTKKSAWCWQKSSCLIYPQGISEDILEGVTIFPTPGHTVDCISVLVKDDNGKHWVIAGDAINIHYLENGSLKNRIGKEGIKSIQKILAFKPDFVVPGHGKIIEKDNLKRFQKFVGL